MENIYVVLHMKHICFSGAEKVSRLCAEQHRQYIKILHTVELSDSTTAQKYALYMDLKIYLRCSAYSAVICPILPDNVLHFVHTENRFTRRP